ncbi:MAG: hypothetical protein JWN73_5196 [Betaproteobacteria bacterium]|nr:hypothetical protein [Betaproteobacteria bacterium]
MTIRIPIIGQSTTTSFVPQQNVQAIQIADPRGEALQGLGKSIGDLGDGLDKYDKAHPAVAFKADQDNNAWTLQAYAQCVKHGSDLTAHYAGISTPGDGTYPAADSVIASANAGADASPLAHPATLLSTPNPIHAMIAGLMPGGSAGAGNPADPNAAANDPSPTDASVHGTTGAWINGYDLGARAAIAAAPSKSVAASLAAQCDTDRRQGARTIMGLEAKGNVQQRQSTALSAAQTIATYGVAADPATLPQALAFFQRHPIRIEGSAADQASFDASLRQTLVGAGIKTLLARDPQGTLRQLQGETGEKGKNEEDGTGEPEPAAALHPAIAALTPEERASYLPQAVRAVVVADSNFRAGVRQGAAAASQSYLAPGNAANPPRPEDFTRAFGAEEGQRQYQQMQEAQQSGQIRQQILPLPDSDLQRMLDEAGPRQFPGDVISPPHGHGPGFQGLEGVEGATMAPDRIAVAPPPGSRPRSLDGIVPDRIEVAPSRFGLLERQIQSLRRQRANDPIQAAQDASSYGVKPIDFTQAAASGAALGAALQGRAQVADDIARAYNVAPAVLSQAEVRQLAVTLQGRKPDEQQALLKQISDGINNFPLTQDTLRALSVHEPVIALAGFHQANESANDDGSEPASGGPAITATAVGQDDTGLIDASSTGAQGAWGGDGKLDAVELLLRGNALVQPQGDGAQQGKPLPMPPFQEMWHSFSDLTGNAYASHSGAETMQFSGAHAIYAELKRRDGDQSTELDPSKMQAAVFIADNGSATPRTAGLLTNVSFAFFRDDNTKSIEQANSPPAGNSSPRANPGGPTDWNRTLPGVAPLAKEDGRKVAEQAQAFKNGVGDLLAATQSADPAAFSESGKSQGANVMPQGINSLRNVGKWLAQDPKHGEMLLQQSFGALLARDGKQHQLDGPLTPQHLDQEVAKSGTSVQEAWRIVKSVVETIRTGDPTDPDTARSIGVGMYYLRQPEFHQVATGLVLGMLSMQGDTSAAVEKIIAASQQKDPEQPLYVWHGATAADLDTAAGIASASFNAGAEAAVPIIKGAGAKGAKIVGDAAREAANAFSVVPPSRFAEAAGAARFGRNGVPSTSSPMAAAGEKPGSSGGGKTTTTTVNDTTPTEFNESAPVNSKHGSNVSREEADNAKQSTKGPSGTLSTEKYLESRWDKATFGTTKDSIDYHLKVHGQELTAVEYTQRAEKAFRDPSAKRTPGIDKLGRPAVRIESKIGEGTFTPKGKIIFFHPNL